MSETNGTAPDPPADQFPCETFRDAARHMRRPFTSAAVKFKVQATWPKDDPHSGLIVSYIDARLVVERLNLLAPHLWHDAYRAVGQGQMWCDLTVDGITRSDVGEGQGKGLVSDALKRAAVKFGIGVSLYAVPKMILKVQSGAVKSKQTAKGKTLELTPQGEQILRDTYEHWLDQHGKQAFGEPLDHGDVIGAQGDHEADDTTVPDGVDPATGEITGPPAELLGVLEQQARDVIDRKIWTGANLKANLVAAGATDTSSVTVALHTLTPENAATLRDAMAELLAARAEKTAA